ncbi:MAG: hypothetical protein WD294_16535 [Phycisphaeraceae bacterium]
MLQAALLLCLLAIGCESPGRTAAVTPYYQHDYPTARQQLRPLAADRRSEDVLLNNMRLGLAAMADGDHHEAERSLLRAYEYLRTGGINEADRTVFSTVLYEGIRVWKGEPYEQAMSYYYIAAYHMLIQDWENARAAASNALFTLRDFDDAGNEPQDMHDLVTDAARAERLGEKDYFTNAYRPVESEFALGYLVAATNYVLMGQPADGADMFDLVRQMRPDLAPLADELQHGSYDTLLLVDVGRGPRKEAYGPDGALIRYRPDGRRTPPLRLTASIPGQGLEHVGTRPVVDLWRLSQYPRWWSLESMRKAKSDVGTVLLGGGLGAAYIGSGFESREAVYAGLAAAALGAAMKASAKADTRHLEFLPRAVFMVPLELGPGRHDVQLHIQNDAGSSATWHDLEAGETGQPSVYFLRMHNAGGRGMPRWPDQPLYAVEPYQLRQGHRPWIMGGPDLSPPSPELLERYQSLGMFPDWTYAQFQALYEDEGLRFQFGPIEPREGDGKRWGGHVTEGGNVLFTPPPGNHLYQRLRRTSHPPYSPRSETLRNTVQRSEP